MGVDRISTRASSTLIRERILRLQAELVDQELQVGTEKKSQTYKGLAFDSQRLLNMEHERRQLDRYVGDIATFEVRIKTTSVIIQGVQADGTTAPEGGVKQVISDFRNQLVEFMGGSMTDEQRVKNIQRFAYDAMKSMEVFLNEDINGQFLFGGTSTQTQPVDLGTTTQTALQTKYDGYSRMYPWTRDAHVDTDLTTAAATTGNITTVWNDNGTSSDPTDDTGTITAANAGTLSAIPVGSLVTINGGVNDGKTVTVVSNDGTTINFTGHVTPAGGTADFWVGVPSDVVDSGGAEAGVTLSVDSYYSGDREEINQRLSKDASIDVDVNATHAAFEKAIRAFGIIAQGEWGSTDAVTGLSTNPGNLSNNTDRTDEAYWLLTSALNINNTGTPPYGAADQSGTNKLNIEQLEIDLGFFEVKMDRTVKKHEDLMDFYSAKIAEIENVDTLEILSSMLDNQRALEASYQVMSRVKQLSLSNYL